MKTYLLPAGMKTYKANLHCHTDVSDAKLSPAEVKALYKANGYSVVAFTDHEVMVDHSDLADPDFLPLRGVEVDVNAEGYATSYPMPCYHINFIAKDEGQMAIPCFNRTYNAWLIMNDKRYLDEQRCIGPDDYERHYTKIQEVVDAFRQNGFFSILNHPTWSIQDTADYLPVEGFDAMEIFNSGSYYQCGFSEINEHEYDAMLRRGKRLYCVAADDNHGSLPATDPASDLMRAWVNIRADKLTYPSIISALEKGNFYASTGPKIAELSVEDGILTVKCSPAARVNLYTFGRRCKVAYPATGEKTLTTAKFEIKATDVYFRVVVSDGREHYAWSNAYFLEDVFGIPMPDGTEYRK